MSKEVYERLEEKSLGVTTEMHRAISEFDPEYVESVLEFYHHMTIERGVLPRKVKELIIMSVNAAQSRWEGVRIHLKRALLSGASPREVLEALETAAIPGGLPVMWYGAEILKQELDAMGKAFE